LSKRQEEKYQRKAGEETPCHPTTYPEGETQWGVQHVVTAIAADTAQIISF